MKGLPTRCALVLVLAGMLGLLPAPAQTDPALRETGVLYFEGNVAKKPVAILSAGTTVYLRRDFATILGAFQPGQEMELVGMSPEGYLVKGTFRNNAITGWIKPEDLPSGFDTSLFESAKKNQERHEAVAAAIKAKSVIQGMTPDEVKLSVGRPEEVSSRTDAKVSLLTWIYTTYREEPQYNYVMNGFGQPVLQTYYVKIPIGQLIVGFRDGAVVSVEEHKSDPRSPGIVTE